MPLYRNVVLGGGLVAGYAAQTFVEEHSQPGSLAIVSAEKMLPYDRPPLSKKFLLGEKYRDDILINSPDFYAENGIRTYLDNPAIRVDFTGQRLFLADETELAYEQLLIATGSRLRRFDLPGSELNGLFYLRDVHDARQIQQAARQARNAVVIGGSFIGMEVASVLRQLGINTTMIFPEDRVWQTFFTPLMSAFFEKYYRDRGIQFLTGSKIDTFNGNDRVEKVKITRADQSITVRADMVVAGIGVEPNVALFAGSDLEMRDGILVNRYLETNIKGVFAAGDVARYPDQIFDRTRRVEHWDNAVSQGQHAARMMMGEREPFVHVPYFFSDVFDLSYEFWGDSSRADNVVHRGDTAEGKFSVWWLAGDRLQAAFVMNRPDEERELAQKWIRSRQTIPVEKLVDTSQPLTELTLAAA